jgi:hypothetical protein
VVHGQIALMSRLRVYCAENSNAVDDPSLAIELYNIGRYIVDPGVVHSWIDMVNTSQEKRAALDDAHYSHTGRHLD